MNINMEVALSARIKPQLLIGLVFLNHSVRQSSTESVTIRYKKCPQVSKNVSLKLFSNR